VTTRRCKICVLPENFPGAELNDYGICRYCRQFKAEGIKEQKAVYQSRFRQLIEQKRGTGKYDCLVAYSGGKDSTYTLYLIKSQYNLRPLAVTFDNGFVAPSSLENITRVTEHLQVDHQFLRPPFEALRKIFVAGSQEILFPPQALTRASTICTACMALVKFNLLRIAIEEGIPFVVYGWSPGQIPLSSAIFKNNSTMLRKMQSVVQKPLIQIAGEAIGSCFLEEWHFQQEQSFPYNISLLAFHHYDEEEIFQTIRTLGWTQPKGVDANSTNCLLNSFANQVHQRQFGFHPYVFELAKLVREGHLSREVALERLERGEDPQTMDYVSRKLGIKLSGDPTFSGGS